MMCGDNDRETIPRAFAHMAIDTDELRQLATAITEAAKHPIEEAFTMPPGAYTSTALLEFERREIFAKEWICLGRVEEIPNPGDYFTIKAANEPLIVMRNDEAQIHVMTNVCRHKWTQLLEGAGNVNRIVCPYHAWTYNRQGQLVHCRYMEQAKDFDPGKIALPRVRSEIWRGFIYITFNDDAVTVAEQFADLDRRTHNYHIEEMKWVCGGEEVWATNWKLLVENFTDLYHIFHTHRDSIDKYGPIDTIEMRKGDGHYSFSTCPVLRDAMESSPFEPCHPALTGEQRDEFSMVGMFPAQTLALAPDRVFYMCLEPVDVDHVRTKWGVACYEPEPSEKLINDMDSLYRQVNREDLMRLENIQTSLRSRFAATGRISHYENMNLEFTRYLAERLTHNRNDTRGTPNEASFLSDCAARDVVECGRC